MASNTLPNPTCNICSELYTDARMLPCLHSFCKKCIEKLIEEQGSKQAFKCPTCNKLTDIPERGVDGIPQDVRSNNEAEKEELKSKIASPSGVKCDNCIRVDSGPAVVFCCNGCEFLCKVCKDHHKKWRKTQKHEVVEVGEKKEGQEFNTTLPPKQIPCPNHGDEVLKFYCETCETLICRDCIVLMHKDHEYDRLEIVAEKEKMDLYSSMEGANQAMEELDDAMGSRDKLVQQIEQKKTEVDHVITKGFKQLYETLRRREEALLAKSAEISLGKTSTLQIKRKELEDLRGEIDDTCQLITRAVKTYAPSELLSTKKLMKAKLHDLLKKFQGTILLPSQTALMPTSLDTSLLLEAIPTLGAVAGGSCLANASAEIYIPRAIVSKQANIKVMTRDESDKWFAHGGENVWGFFGLLGSSDPPVMATTNDNGDGTYVISFTPTTTGEHQLTVMVNGQDVSGSPFVISVHEEREYRSLSRFQKQIKTGSSPWDVGVHDNGDLYVALSSEHRIQVFTSNGTEKLSFGTQGNGQGQFSSPYGIALREDVVYVAEYSNKRVQKLTTTGEHQAFIGEGELGGPYGICLDPNGKIFVADYSNNRVQVFNRDGTFAYSITGNSGDNSNLTNPWGVAFDSDGQLHVASRNSNLIRVFTAAGKIVATYGSGQMSNPSGITIDEEGYTLVSEYASSSSSRIHVFDPQHQHIHSFTTDSNLCGMAVDRDGIIWCTECHRGRVSRL